MDRRRRAARTVALMSLFTMADTQTDVPIASFDGDGSDLISLIVGIEPVQNLHGFDNPWPAGGGVNKYPIAIGEDGWSDNADATHSNSDGELLIVCTDRSYSGVFGNGQQRALINRQSVAKTVSMDIKASVAMPIEVQGNVKDVTTSYQRISVTIAANTLASLTIYGRGTAGTIYVKNLAITEDGSTAYAPYSNICPISGWTGANIHVSPTTDAADGETYSITFPTSAGTVYGGTLDVTTGKLTVDRAMFTWTSATDGYIATSKAYIHSISDAVKIDNSNQYTLIGAICDKIKSAAWADIASRPNEYLAGCVYGQGLAFRIPGFTTVSEYTAWLADNPLTFVYKLATPIVYDLTPTQVTTLIGTNNIWADTGDIKYIEYNI